jgi:hypothetical protein
MATKSGYYIDSENDSWARREAVRRGTSKSDVGRDALTQYRRSIDAVPSLSKVRSITVRTTTSGTGASRGNSTNTSSTENETDFWRMATFLWMSEARNSRIDSHGTEVFAGDPSSVVARSTNSGSAEPQQVFRRGSIVRVRRGDGSAYLAKIC